MALKWKMISHTEFVAEHEGYTVEVSVSSIGTWRIFKYNVLVEHCMYHSPARGELANKIQAEKVLNQLIQKQP